MTDTGKIIFENGSEHFMPAEMDESIKLVKEFIKFQDGNIRFMGETFDINKHLKTIISEIERLRANEKVLVAGMKDIIDSGSGTLSRKIASIVLAQVKHEEK